MQTSAIDVNSITNNLSLFDQAFFLTQKTFPTFFEQKATAELVDDEGRVEKFANKKGTR